MISNGGSYLVTRRNYERKRCRPNPDAEPALRRAVADVRTGSAALRQVVARESRDEQDCRRAAWTTARWVRAFRMNNSTRPAASARRNPASANRRVSPDGTILRGVRDGAAQLYDMASVGAKSQPIIATAFRSKLNPDHRVFCSLLLTDYFDAATKARIEALLATREVFPRRPENSSTRTSSKAA